MADTIDEAIEENALGGIQSTTIDGFQAVNMPIADQIAADQYLASKAAAAARKPGFRLSKFLPPGMAD